MRRAELTQRLISADAKMRRLILAENVEYADLRLSEEIRLACIAAWSSDPQRVKQCVAAAKSLVQVNRESLVSANADWTSGIGDIVAGAFGSAVDKLARAAFAFLEVGNEIEAAQTQVAALLALAMLGRYDDAIAAGLSAIPILTKHGDELTAGKIEMNLSNIFSRRSDHREAERFCSSARKRFIKAGESKWQAMAENGLANSYAELNDFAKAERFYSLAFETAVAAKMHVTEAEIEASMGNLALFRGRYADALRYLELSRRKFEVLAMPHQTAIADLEIADIYAELNLNADAIEIYARVADAFHALKLRGEEARARLNFGRSAMRIHDHKAADKQLANASKLFLAEKNNAGLAASNIAKARLALDQGDLDMVFSIIEKTKEILALTQDPRLPISVQLIDGEAYLLSGDTVKAEITFESALADAKRLQQSDSVQTSLNFLGKTALVRGDKKAAESFLKRSARIVEGLRAPLASEEFSMSFLAGRLGPFDDLVKLYLAENRIADAFRTIESRRSRFLYDTLRGANTTGVPDDLSDELMLVREELNSYYKRLDRAEPDDDLNVLNTAIRQREARVSKMAREIASLATTSGETQLRRRSGVKKVQKQLGRRRVLIEFVEIDGVFSAFVVTGSMVRFIHDLGAASEIAGDLDDLHFQFGSLRYGTAGMERFLGQMTKRANACLERLYDRLIAPIEHLLSGESLVIVPAGLLYYIPFHALYDGEQYLVERFETTYAPSAGVWDSLQEREARTIESSLLVGFADERIPLVEKEVEAIRRIVAKPKTLTGDNATFAAFTKNAGKADLIHLACHGQFRSDNPMFSSLHLADGWVTVRDICEQRISAELVVLSACETGLSKVFAGDEILGLARAFLSAGAASLIVSLWTVNDDASSRLMLDLYNAIQRGNSPGASLRQAQLNAIKLGEHPYLWAPFVRIGR